MRKFLSCCLLVLVFAIAGCSDNSNQTFGGAPVPVEQTHSITGRLTGLAFQGIIVELRDASGNVVAQTVTDANGNYTFNNIANGNYRIAVNSGAGTGYSYESADVTVSGADLAVADISLKLALMNHIYSGTSCTRAVQIIETRDHCLAVVGYTDSSLPNEAPYDTPSDYHGEYDIWVLKIDPAAADKESGILFNHCYGGSNNDFGSGIVETSDGMLAVVATTGSYDGDITDPNGDDDILVLKIDPSDNSNRGLLFNHCYGGNNEDYGCSIAEMPDGKLAVVGDTYSVDGDVVGYHGDSDILVLKIDASDNSNRGLLFNHCYGGSGYDSAFFDDSYEIESGNSIAVTSDGKLALVGTTDSVDGDVVGNHGGSDILVLKIDPSDNSNRGLLFNHCYGGTYEDYGNGIVETSDGKLAVVGYTESNDGDIVGDHGYYDILVLKIDPSDNTNRGLLFNHCYGGSSNDYGVGIAEMSDGKLAVVGYTYSDDYDAVGNHGEFDILVLKIDTSDNSNRGLTFSRCYGGSDESEYGYGIAVCADGCIAICGTAYSNYPDGDIPSDQSNDYDEDYWILKINNAGNYSL